MKPRLAVGDFIEIPSWNVWGCVDDVQPATIGSDDAIVVRLQLHAEQPVEQMRTYRLEPDQYVVID